MNLRKIPMRSSPAISPPRNAVASLVFFKGLALLSDLKSSSPMQLPTIWHNLKKDDLVIRNMRRKTLSDNDYVIPENVFLISFLVSLDRVWRLWSNFSSCRSWSNNSSRSTSCSSCCERRSSSVATRRVRSSRSLFRCNNSLPMIMM